MKAQLDAVLGKHNATIPKIGQTPAKPGKKPAPDENEQLQPAVAPSRRRWNWM